MRLIDADELKEKVKGSWGTVGSKRDFIKIIDNAPTIEPKELPPLVNKVVEVLPELTDAIIDALPEIVSKLIKCSECSYYRDTWNAIPRPQGEWIKIDDVPIDGYKKCSNCNTAAEWLDGGSQFLSNFCPNCGADMRGEK